MLLAQVLIPAATAAAVLFAAWFSLDALRRPGGPSSQTGALHHALGPLLLRQLAALGAAVLVAASATGLTMGYLVDSWQQGALAAGSLLAGAVCSGLAFHIGAGIVTATASRAADGANPAPGAALSASIVPAILGPGLVTGALGGLVGAAAWLFDEPVAQAPHLVVAFALGTGLVAAVVRLTGGIAANASGLAASLVPPGSEQVQSLAIGGRAASLSFAAARSAEIAESTALTTLAAVLLGATMAWTTGDAGWLLLPLVLLAVAVLATIAGGLTVQLLSMGSATPDVLLVRSLAVISILGAGGYAAVAWAMLPADWYWFFGAASAGVVAALLLLLLSRRSPLGPWRAARRVARASQTSPASNVVTGFAAGLESAALTALVVALVIAAGYALAAQAGVAHVTSTTAGLAGVGLAGIGFLLPGQFIAAWSPVATLLESKPAAGDALPEQGDDPGLRPPDATPAAAAETCGYLVRTYALAATALAVCLSLFAFAALIRTNLASAAVDDPERYAALVQDLDLLQPGDDVKFAAANAIAAHVAALEALRESVADDSRFGPREVRQLAVATRIETVGIVDALIDDDALTPRQAGGIEPSPLPLPGSLPVSSARPGVLAAGFAGLLLALFAAAAAIRAVGRTAGELISTTTGGVEPTQPGEPPALQSISATAARPAGRVLLPVFICSIIVPVALGAAIRYGLGESGNDAWLVVAGLLLFGGIGAVAVAVVLDGASTVWGVTAASITALADPGPGGAPSAAHPGTALAASTGAETGETFRTAAVPALAAFAKLAAAAALAFASLFVS